MPPGRTLVVPMLSRDTREEHRTATPLELFFDLCFVVAVAAAANELHHGMLEHPGFSPIRAFGLSFFGVWWAWLNFTWFASAFDTDDAAYRFVTLVQMAGVLIYAAGVPDMVGGDFGVGILGYLVMRVALIAQWLRAGASDRTIRPTAYRYATGVAVCQVLWVVAWFVVPHEDFTAAFVVLAACEMLVPMWAERAGPTSWHAGHIVERYGLFTLIVLGESVLAATSAVQSALVGGDIGEVVTIAAGGLLLVFGMWWLYFDTPVEELMEDVREHFAETQYRSFLWGYGHYLVFATAAAVGAGLQVAVDHATHHDAVGHGDGLTDLGAGLVVTVPAALFLVSLWILLDGSSRDRLARGAIVPVVAVAMVATSWTGEPVLWTGLLVLALVIWKQVRPEASPPPGGRTAIT
jgi:low temperature requirement protein LtrA